MTDQMLPGSYDYRLVVLSVLIAIPYLSYTALDRRGTGHRFAALDPPRLAYRRRHRARVMEKLNLRTVSDLAHFAIRNKIVQL